jgi:hypothetical protein
VLFQLLIPGLTTVSLLEGKSGFEIVMQLAHTGRRPLSHYIVYGKDTSKKRKIHDTCLISQTY